MYIPEFFMSSTLNMCTIFRIKGKSFKMSLI